MQIVALPRVQNVHSVESPQSVWLQLHCVRRVSQTNFKLSELHFSSAQHAYSEAAANFLQQSHMTPVLLKHLALRNAEHEDNTDVKSFIMCLYSVQNVLCRVLFSQTPLSAHKWCNLTL